MADKIIQISDSSDTLLPINSKSFTTHVNTTSAHSDVLTFTLSEGPKLIFVSLYWNNNNPISLELFRDTTNTGVFHSIGYIEASRTQVELSLIVTTTAGRTFKVFASSAGSGNQTLRYGYIPLN